MAHQRASGILLHITSLPSWFGIGDMGPEAFHFIDFLKKAHQRWWQILPLTYTDGGVGYSPYSSPSAFAGNIWLVSPELLVQDGWLMEKHLPEGLGFPEGKVDFDKAALHKKKILKEAYHQFKAQGTGEQQEHFLEFERSAGGWLNDFTLFMALKARFNNKPWNEWPKEFRDREVSALHDFSLEMRGQIEETRFYQFLVFHQWGRLKKYANEEGVQIFGDLPFYINHDSADVWANPGYFKLDDSKKPLAVSGVPPDYFSADGQLWGTPVYDWAALEKNGFDWWLKRIEHNLYLYDLLRIDHFRAFSAYWEVPAGAATAREGHYVPSPGHRFFSVLQNRFPEMPFVAEDLGDIDEPVKKLMHDFGLPGMLVLQFAFDESLPHNTFAPHNHRENYVVYPGTHDNNTAIGWWNEEATSIQKGLLEKYTGQKITDANIHKIFIRMALGSVARTAIIPMQDILGLGPEGIMNVPGSSSGQWAWKMPGTAQLPGIITELRELASIFNR